MINNSLFKNCAALVLGVMSIYSCLSEPEVHINSEIEVPNGSVNYFTNNMDFDFEGGSQVMAFKINVKWDMQVASTQNGDKWLTIDPSTGNSGSNKVTFTAGPNNSYEDRSVIVRLSTGDTVRTVRVNQKRLEAITLTSDVFQVPVSGGTVNIEVNHSADYEIIIPDNYKSWIHPASNGTRGLLQASTTAFIIDPSEEYENREGKIYVKSRDEEEVVTIYQAGEGKLVLSQNEVPLTGEEQEFTIDVNSNFDFSMEMPAVDWLKENTSKTRGMSSHTLKFKVTENDDYNARSAKIKLYDKNSKLSETVVINQASIGAKIILEKQEFSIGSEKQDLDIDVQSNFDYDVDFQGATWIKQRSGKTRGGISSRLLKLSVDENEGFDTRTAKIKLYDKNSDASEEITITQLPSTPTISAEKKEYEVDANKQNLDIKISSNVDYTVDFQETDWIKDRNAPQTRSLATNTLKLEIAKNDDYDSRSAQIKLTAKDGSATETITITQKPKTEIEISEKEITVDELGGIISFDVNANVDYKITCNNDWIKELEATTRGLETRTHQFTIDALGNGENRQGTITFANEDLKISKTVTIKQRQTLYFNNAEVTVLKDKTHKLSITNLTGQDITWSSSNESIATVNKEGIVTGMNKGDATITATTADGKHSTNCTIQVREITQLIEAYCNGGDAKIEGSLLKKGSKLSWTFHNDSPAKVRLKSYQMIDGDNISDKEQAIGEDIQAGNSKVISTSFDQEDVSLPITCLFKYEYDGKTYTIKAEYNK